MNRSLAILFFSACLLFSLAGCGGSDPDAQLKAINELIAKDFPIAEQQLADIEKLVAEGNESLKAGDTGKAGASFDEAIKILKLAEDAHMFNKSE
jgi:Tfp pilus assembly protein PilF